MLTNDEGNLLDNAYPPRRQISTIRSLPLGCGPSQLSLQEQARKKVHDKPEASYAHNYSTDGINIVEPKENREVQPNMK